MFISPSMILFFLCIISSIFMVTSSPSLMFSWIGLELNTLAFIPLILNSNNKSSNESAIKYFLTQTLASIFFLLGVVLPLDFTISNLFILVGIMIKLGAAPFHSWLPGIVESLSWGSLFILLTIQKINPLLILVNPQPTCFLLTIPIWSCLVVGAFMGMVQTQMRSLLMYSSINHMGWMLVAWNNSNYSLLMYFVMYMVLLLPLFILFSSMNCVQLNHLTNLPLPLTLQFITFSLLLSLGGLPPFLGFLPKLMILQDLLILGENSLDMYTCFIMIFMSLLTLFYYLRLAFSAFIFSNSKWSLVLSYPSFNNYFFLFSSISILGFSLSFVFYL